MEELALQARSFDSKPKALSKRLEDSEGERPGVEGRSKEGFYLSTTPGITKF